MSELLMSSQLVTGNEAIALGVVEQGCRLMTAYPGTPSSEILAGVIKYKKQFKREIYTEWSVNEKVAFEVALAATWTGLRAAVTMKQVGLNVASDPLFSAAYTGVKGGFLIIPSDDPGPHSSQTEQDSRLFALVAKIPVFDPSTPAEAREMVKDAFELSERFKIPVILRPTTRLCHAVSLSADESASFLDRTASSKFQKDPSHWTATPKLRNKLHAELNQKLIDITAAFSKSKYNYIVNEDIGAVGIIASGVAFHTARQALTELGVRVPMLKIGTPYPLPVTLIESFCARYKTVIVLEEPDACIELQMPNRNQVRGRLDGSVPNAGELTPEVMFSILHKVFSEAGIRVNASPEDNELGAFIKTLSLPMRRPRLCPGCSHRSAFYAMKRTFGTKAIYPGDIGCYTLGTNLRAVDTFVDMGASITMANGFSQASRLSNDDRAIIATIGDSTFLHSGVAPLINAVHTGARFVLVILDNHTTAMTGFQPTPASDRLADGSEAPRKASIPDLVRACGVEYLKVTDPYEQEDFTEVLKEAHAHTQAPNGGVAVIIADRPCVLYDRSPILEHPLPVVVTDECDGCRFCTEAFECPALVLRPDSSRVDIDYKLCVDCGQCIDACYKGFIIPKVAEMAA
ncbi:MAG: indolepyruvate ferredoxin oxidoreductase subunit alpha [Anaerolineales bacterium]|nr:indolepyruvate ferredoxin oxidoreductase subunit alpha [Anaerolineales bacterium]